MSGRRPPVEPYPATVAECLRDGKRYKPAALRALRAFRRARQWRLPARDRARAFRTLHTALCGVYGLRTRLVISGGRGFSGDSGYSWRLNRIVLRGRLSLVTYLHEFGHARGKGERGACVWSINLFRRIFPRSFARLVPVGHTLQRRGRC